MSERLNKTSICSVVFLDIIDYSKQPVSRQIEVKEQFNALLGEAIKNIAQNDRIILDTGDGAAISLLGAPEEALFVSLTIRDGILNYNKDAQLPLNVRIGINLGPVRVVRDINGQPNIIGDGINVAQRVMSFADVNQILVSRSYYEVTSRLSDEITSLFAYSGIKHDKHVREHEVYAIRASGEEVTIPEVVSADKAVDTKPQSVNKRNPWLIPGAVLLLIVGAGLPFLFGVHKQNTNIKSESHLEQQPAETSPQVAQPKPTVELKPAVAEAKPVTKTVEAKTDSAVDQAPKEVAKKKTAKKAKATNTETVGNANNESHTSAENAKASQPVTSPSSNDSAKTTEKSSWDSFTQSVKQGTEKKNCTQAEIALNQCR